MRKNLKQLSTLFATFALLLTMVSPVLAVDSYVTASSPPSYPGGNGSPGDPYVVTTCMELQNMNYELDAYYVLGNNIDCSGTTSWNEGAGFIPVGEDYINPFSGEFDGAGYTISGLYMDWYESSFVGLFGFITNRVHDFTLSNVNITGYDYVGGVTGVVDEGYVPVNGFTANIEDVHVSGEVNGYATVGGVVGFFEGSGVKTSSSSATVTGESEVIGGFVGEADSGEFLDSYATGDVEVTNGYYVGGFVGIAGDEYEAGSFSSSEFEIADGPSVYFYQSHATGTVTSDDGDAGGFAGQGYYAGFERTYATGDVYGGFGSEIGGFVGDCEECGIFESFATGDVYEGDSEVGGFIGIQDYGYIENSYARGDVVDVEDEDYGGFVGELEGDIENSYATGAVSGDSDSYEGGFTGYEDDGEADYCFWDVQTSGLSDSDDDCEGKTTAEMKDIDTFTTDLEEDAWDFEGIWGIDSGINDGYPHFLWHDYPEGDSDDDGITNETEDNGPNSGDANGDGMMDSSQDDVSSFTNTLTEKYTVLEVDDSCTIETVVVNSEESNTTQDDAFDYPAGLMDFTLDCGTPGFSATIVQIYYGVDVDDLVARKYNSVTETYQAIDGATITSVEIGGEQAARLSYTVVDGGELDEDGTANGTIVDPSGFGTAALAPPNTGFGGPR